MFSGNCFVKLPLSCEREPAVWNEAAEGEFNCEVLLRGAWRTLEREASSLLRRLRARE